MKQLLVLYGGKSGEHDVSLQSAASLIKHLDKNKFAPQLIGIDKDGRWYYQDCDVFNHFRDQEKLRLKLDTQASRLVSIIPEEGLFIQGNKIECDVIFPMLHGTFGEDGTLQGMLDFLEIPYIGSGVLGSALSMDKEKVKAVWEQAGLPVVPYKVVRKEFYSQNPEKWHNELADELGFPMYIKPCRAGSSVGVSRVENKADLEKAFTEAFDYDTKIICEPGVTAREIECSVIGNESPRAFFPGEVASSHAFYDYEAKYTDPNGAEIIIPAPIDDKLGNKLMNIAVSAYQLAEARGLSRVDFFLDVNSGAVYLNEINTLPGFTRISMFPMMCAHGGLAYTDMICELIRYAEEEFASKHSLSFGLKEKAGK